MYVCVCVCVWAGIYAHMHIQNEKNNNNQVTLTPSPPTNASSRDIKKKLAAMFHERVIGMRYRQVEIVATV